MYDFLQAISLQETFLVTIGGLIGSFLRFYLLEFMFLFSSKRYIGTIFVNSLSTFLLSLILASGKGISLSFPAYYIFIMIGLLGSLSTFSTFIIEVLNSFLDKAWKEGFEIIVLSIILSMIMSWLGFFVRSI